MIKAIGYISSIALIAFGMWVLLTGMSFAIEFIGISQLVKILGIVLISVGGVGLFCTLNAGK